MCARPDEIEVMYLGFCPTLRDRLRSTFTFTALPIGTLVRNGEMLAPSRRKSPCYGDIAPSSCNQLIAFLPFAWLWLRNTMWG